MENNNSLREVFAVVGERLYLYESEKYLQNNPFGPEMAEEFQFDEPFDYQWIMDDIGLKVNRFDPLDVYKESSYYAVRIDKIIKSLKKKTHKTTWDGKETFEVGGVAYPVLKEEEVDEFFQKLYYDGWRKELIYCYSVLREIMEARSHVIPTNEKVDVKQMPPIELPTKRPIAKLQQHFKPQLNEVEAAIFLQVLQDLQVMPLYTQSHTAWLGSFLFGKSMKNISNNLREVQHNEAEEESFKNVLALLERMNLALKKKLEKDVKNNFRHSSK